MYNEFFGFNEEPFKITPDPEYMYLSSKHEEALELLEYGINHRKGFLTLIGEVGTGKSTLIRYLIRKFPNTHISLILNPFLSPDELLYSIAKDFGIDISLCLNKGDVYSELTKFLVSAYKNGKNALVIIDEAQNLSFESFEIVRQLSNIELENDKLLQIVLSAQPELETLLQKNEFRQLNQRISIRAKLDNFDFEDTENYIIHRINVATGIRKYIFEKYAIKRIYYYTKGNPREINQICDKSLLIAYSKKRKKVDEKIVEQAAKDYYINFKNNKFINKKYLFSFLSFVLLGIFILYFLNSKVRNNLYSENMQKNNQTNLIKIENKNLKVVDNETQKDNQTQNNITDFDKLKDNLTSDNQSIKNQKCLYPKKNINLRDSPSKKAHINIILKENKKYIIDNYNVEGNWVYVSFEKNKGYIYNDERLYEIKDCNNE